MPKTGRITQDERELSSAIRSYFDGATTLSLEQVRQVIGVKSRKTAECFVKTLVPTWINGRRRYFVSDVAARLIAGRTGVAV